MAGTITRKQFLRGDFNNQHAPVRPPWAQPEHLFLENCTLCSDCLGACPEKILVAGSGQYPEVDFSRGECSFCFSCVESCRSGALDNLPETQPWTLKANITKQCLVFQGVHCMICREQCEAEAISFIPKVALPPYPVINPLLCSGCGACFQPCPNQSIKLKYDHTYQTSDGSAPRESAL